MAKSVKRKSLTGFSDEAVKVVVVSDQGGRCPICLNTYDEGKRKPAVDHEKAPGENKNSRNGRGRHRGIVCQSCNTMLGFAADDQMTLRRAAVYLYAFANPRFDKDAWRWGR